MTDTYKFSFPSFIRDEFDKKFNGLNKKLKSMKDGEEVVIVGEEFEERKVLKPEPRRKHLDTRHLEVAERYVFKPEDYLDVIFTIVEVSIPSVNKIAGYKFAGTINIVLGVKTIFSVDDNVNLAEVDVQVCHHCNTRRNRARLHVFTEVATGNHKAIGSTCVHEYVGVDIDKVLHTFFNFYKEEDFYGSRGMRDAWGFPIVDLANAVRVAYALNSNYVKVDRYSDNDSTKSAVDRIHNVLTQPNEWNLVEAERFNEVLKTAPKVGSLIVDTYGDLDETESNFNSNIVESLFYVDGTGNRKLRDFIVGKTRGIFVWAVFNALKKSVTPPAPKVVSKPSYHVGNVGERIVIDAEVTFTKICNSDWGDSKMVKLQDKDGNQFVTFGTGQGLWDINVGDEVSAKGTVSKHDEFNGVRQTCLKRLTVVGV